MMHICFVAVCLAPLLPSPLAERGWGEVGTRDVALEAFFDTLAYASRATSFGCQGSKDSECVWLPHVCYNGMADCASEEGSR